MRKSPCHLSVLLIKDSAFNNFLTRVCFLLVFHDVIATNKCICHWKVPLIKGRVINDFASLKLAFYLSSMIPLWWVKSPHQIKVPLIKRAFWSFPYYNGNLLVFHDALQQVKSPWRPKVILIKGREVNNFSSFEVGFLLVFRDVIASIKMSWRVNFCHCNKFNLWNNYFN